MKIAFLFSGQGAQYSGMMKDIVGNSPAARKVFDTADQALDRSISSLCFAGSQEDLNMTHNTQPCVLAADLAAYHAIIEAGIKPDVVAGFSLGEYAALVAAGVIQMSDVFPLIQKRADFMQDAVPVGHGAMAAVMKLSDEEVENLCKEVEGYVEPANYNCPGQIVVSGEIDAVNQLLAITKERRVRAMKLPVSAPFHCNLMAPAADKLGNELNRTKMLFPTVPVYMNVDAEPENEPEQIRSKLYLQAKSPVRWEATLRNMQRDGIDTFVELGPGKTLSGFVKKTLADVTIMNVTDLESLKNTLDVLKAGAE